MQSKLFLRIVDKWGCWNSNWSEINFWPCGEEVVEPALRRLPVPCTQHHVQYYPLTSCTIYSGPIFFFCKYRILPISLNLLYIFWIISLLFNIIYYLLAIVYNHSIFLIIQLYALYTVAQKCPSGWLRFYLILSVDNRQGTPAHTHLPLFPIEQHAYVLQLYTHIPY